MKKKAIYFFTIIFSIFLGCALMYGIIYYFPNTIVKTITQEERNVTVIDEGISEGITNVYNSVVVVESYSKGSVASTGSGFAFKKIGKYTYLMTNHHVISGASDIIITLADGTEIKANLVGSDAYADIAVLKIENNDSLTVASIESTNDLEVGDTVFAVGAPLGKDFINTVTRGILSGKDRMVETTISDTGEKWIMNVMQTDAAINPGNSGGPLCDVSGNIIGINSLKIVESSVEGLGFAIPIDDALKYADSIIENGKIIRGYIGIQMLNANETFQLARNNITIDNNITDGVVVVEVINDSPAETSGLKSGDIIMKINDNSVTSISKFRYYLYKCDVGETVELLIYRNDETKTIKIKVGISN